MFPLSGYEREFCQDGKWNRYKRSNNCYAYATGCFKKSRPYKSVPGEVSGMNTAWDYTKCGFSRLVLADGRNSEIAGVPGIFEIAPHKKCPPGYYKIASYTSPGGDFHWLVQHGVVKHRVKSTDTPESLAKFYRVPVERIEPLNGKRYIKIRANVWSHKRGWATGPLITGSDGKVITNPLTAKLDYPRMNYSNHCKTYAVRNHGVQVGPMSSVNNVKFVLRGLASAR